jgi:hypothetical protein
VTKSIGQIGCQAFPAAAAKPPPDIVHNLAWTSAAEQNAGSTNRAVGTASPAALRVVAPVKGARIAPMALSPITIKVIQKPM